MHLTTHAAAGMLIGAVIRDPAGAGAAGIMSHFLLDMIPHENREDLILDGALGVLFVGRKKLAHLRDHFLMLLLVGLEIGVGGLPHQLLLALEVVLRVIDQLRESLPLERLSGWVVHRGLEIVE